MADIGDVLRAQLGYELPSHEPTPETTAARGLLAAAVEAGDQQRINQAEEMIARARAGLRPQTAFNAGVRGPGGNILANCFVAQRRDVLGRLGEQHAEQHAVRIAP